MSFKSTFFSASVIGLSAAAGVGFSPAWAQTSEQPAVGGREEISEIVVTARRREESAQAVPVSVSVFGAAQLEQKSVTALEDLTRLTPGLRYTAEGGAQNTTVSLRGLSKIPIGDGTPAVVTYFAEVPLTAWGSNSPTFDLASVQVLKGPQGTLFGRNTIGGAVLVTPAAPSYDSEGYVSATVGDYNARFLEGAVNLPVIEDKLAFRLAGQLQQRDGYTDNIGIGTSEYNNLDQYGLRASVLFEPSESFRNTTIVDYFEGDEHPYGTVQYNVVPGGLSILGGGNPLLAQFDPDLQAQFALQRARGVRTVNSDSPGQLYKRTAWGVTNRTEFDVNDKVTLKNIFGYRETKTLYHSDPDGGPVLTAPGIDVAGLLGTPFPVVIDQLVLLNAGQRTNIKQLSEELQLLGNAFDDRVTWILGAFYLEAQPNGPQGSFFHQFDLIASTTPIGPLHLSPPSGSVLHTDTVSEALYGQVAIGLGVEGLKLNLGYRYTWDDIKICGGNVPNSQLGGATTSSQVPFLDFDECKTQGRVSSTDGFGSLSTKTSAPTWTIGLDYQITSDVFTYVTVRRGYRSGGINSPVFATPCTTGGVCVAPTGEPGADLRQFQFVGPEEVTDIEVGLKSRWSLGQANGLFNIDVFTMDYKDAIQFVNTAGIVPSTDDAQPNNGSVGFNAADLTIRGVEFEINVSPVESLILSTTAAYIDQSVDSIGSVPAPLPQLTADQLTLPTAEWSATAGVRWTLPFRPLDSDLVLSGDYYWTDDWQVQGNPLPSYDVTNFRLEWNDIGGSALSAGAFVTNAFDEEYVLSGVVNLAGFPWNSGMFGPPRMYGVNLKYSFGE